MLVPGHWFGNSRQNNINFQENGEFGTSRPTLKNVVRQICELNGKGQSFQNNSDFTAVSPLGLYASLVLRKHADFWKESIINH